MPWAPARHDSRAERWLDESDVALHAPPLSTGSVVSGDLLKTQKPDLEDIFGQSSVSARLSMNQLIRGGSAGSTSVSAIIGHLYEYGGASTGSSSVSGFLLHGQVEMIAGVSSGVASLEGDYYDKPDLEVRKYSHVSGSQAGDDWGAGEDAPPPGSNSGRTGPGRARNVFSPRASGRVSDQSAWQVPRQGTDGGRGE